ncbi:MAG: hypothetical protein U0527_03425 [Candidatus Eisenbacteria bacterium]
MMHGLEVWVAAFLTLCVFTFLYRDNPLYRFAEHLFVGVSAGYLLAVQYQNVLKPNVIEKIGHGNLLPIIPAALGVLVLGRLWPRTTPLSNWALAFYVGIYSGIAVPAYLQAQIFAQLADAVKPFAHGWAAINSALILLGFLCVIAYFYFSSPHNAVHRAAARAGIWFLMVAFGASFGYTVMARVSLLIARMQFLLRDWLHVLPGS